MYRIEQRALLKSTPIFSVILFNPLPDDKILDRSTLKQSANDNFKFDDNIRKFF